MKLLLIGASSYVGARVYYDLQHKYELMGTYHTGKLCAGFVQLDIRDYSSVRKLIAGFRPDIVVHFANYASSKLVEAKGEDFTKVNLEGTKNIVKALKEFPAKLIFISSQVIYAEPNLYRDLKMQSEKIIASQDLKYSILRPSVVFGISPAANRQKYMDKILSAVEGQVVELDDSWHFQPTYLGHLSQTIEQVISRALWGRAYNVHLDQVTTQYQLASDILAYFGKKPKAINLKLKIPLAPESVDSARSFKLVPSTYHEIVEQVVEEINNRDQFIL